jgi:hypothetical protein
VFDGIERPEHAIERYRFIVDVEIARQLGVGGYEIVQAVDFNAVARVVDHCDIGILRFFRKLTDRAAQIDNAEVPLVVDDIEPGLPEKRTHCRGVVGWIAELRNLLISGDADDQRDALFRSCGIGGDDEQKT